ncbi:MAG TPA: metal-sensing transcriptional repressor [Epulopiscium sp.]|nr:metal-sensing transcriptional repressor [Candidatus Epulonipiscium sp.]
MQADKAKATRLLKTARGQIDGILKMIEDDRYCIDISNQLMATQAILRNVNKEILHAHLGSCVADAFGTQEQRQKIEEIMLVIDKLTK